MRSPTPSLRRPLALFVTLLLSGLFLPAPPVGAQSTAPVPYELLPGSSWLRGCLPPCLCPALFFDGVTGGFSSVYTGTFGGEETFELFAIELIHTNSGDAYVGSGTWRRDPSLGLHRIEATLTGSTGLPEEFDSDWVAWAPTPDGRFEIAISVNGFFCFDTVFQIVAEPIEAFFVRGDCNADSGVNVADAIRLLEALFSPAGPPECVDACDANDDGTLNIADAVALLDHLFAGTGPLPAPTAACGADPTADPIGCPAFPPCP